MGCDFYIYYELVIKCKNQDGNEKVIRYDLEDTYERNDWWICERDTDFEEEEDYKIRWKKKRNEQLKYELDQYKTFTLYKDGSWLCTKSAIQKYMDIIHTHINRQHKRVTEENIIEIIKSPTYKIMYPL